MEKNNTSPILIHEAPDKLQTKVDLNNLETSIINTRKEIKDLIQESLNINQSEITKKLERIFGLNDFAEVNNVETELAQMFGEKTYNKMKDLAYKQELKERKPISFASVMSVFDDNQALAV